MLKNKIYKYLSSEILKNFIIILFTFSIIAWAVRAVNFLDLMIEDGYSSIIYFKYSVLNIFTIITRFIPLSFLISLIISIVKFERQQEFLILWTSGLNKIKITHIFLLIAFFITFLQVILGLIINPFTLNKSRALLRDTKSIQIDSVLRVNDFNDSFKGVTFYIGKKNSNGEFLNVFINDNSGSLKTFINEIGVDRSSTIIAKKGLIRNDKLILFDGIVQTLNKKKQIKNIEFMQTELTIRNLTTRTIKQPKIQETSTHVLFKCLVEKNHNKSLQNCSSSNNKRDVIETLSRRAVMPLYIPLISIISSFLLIFKKEQKYNYLNKYIVFVCAFMILIFTEILLRFTGFSLINLSLYFFTPIVLSLVLYFILIKSMLSEKTI